MKRPVFALSLVSVLISAPVAAQNLSVEITNLTHGTYFAPVLVAAHDSSTHLFMEGAAATASLQAMAEGGNISSLVTDLASTSATYMGNPANGLLAPGATTMTTLDTTGTSNNMLSVVAMMVPTNDGFVGLNSQMIPTEPGTYTYYLNAYDAGTEANDEIINGGGTPGTPGIPAAPGGDGGTGATGVAGADSNTMVHIHRGIVGDTNPTGGVSDLDSRIHRWLNPVAKLVLTVQ